MLMLMFKFFFLLFSFLFSFNSYSYWQQRVEYKISIDFDHKNHQFLGEQNLKYFNNESIDILKVKFYNYNNQLSNNINNYSKKEEYNLIINYKNLLDHLYNYKNYYYILSTLTLLYVI